jgi:hypothetical protein
MQARRFLGRVRDDLADRVLPDGRVTVELCGWWLLGGCLSALNLHKLTTKEIHYE